MKLEGPDEKSIRLLIKSSIPLKIRKGNNFHLFHALSYASDGKRRTPSLSPPRPQLHISFFIKEQSWAHGSFESANKRRRNTVSPGAGFCAEQSGYLPGVLMLTHSS